MQILPRELNVFAKTAKGADITGEFRLMIATHSSNFTCDIQLKLITMKSLISAIVLLLTISLQAQDSIVSNPEIKRSMYDLQKNSIQAEYRLIVASLFYERMFPIGNNTGIAAEAGISTLFFFGSAEPGFSGKLTMLFGGSKHFFEGGVWYSTLPEKFGHPLPILGYRFLSKGGFLLQADVLFQFNIFLPVPGVTFGYAF